MNQTFDELPGNFKPSRPSGFTIVELLVAMALIVFMMSIMSQAFIIATTAMSGLKNVTDMVDKVRPAMAILERDLGAYHFDAQRRLSDANFWEFGPPTQGYFSVWQDKPNSNHSPGTSTYCEGIQNGVAFALASADANHMLAFTVKANPVPNSTSISPDDYFGLNLPYSGIATDILLNNKISGTEVQSGLGNDLAGIYFPPGATSNLTGNKFLNFKNQSLSNNGPSNAQRLEKLLTDWMEVAYFLRDSGRKTDNGVPICTLYRQYRMLLPEANLVNSRTLYLNDGPPPLLPSYSTPPGLTRPLEALYNLSCFTNNDPSRPPLPTNPSSSFWYADSKWPLKFNTPETLTVPWRRLGKHAFHYESSDNKYHYNHPSYNHAGVSNTTNGQDFLIPYNLQNSNHPGAFSDVFLNNVLSFEVKLMIDNSMNFKSLWETAGVNARNIYDSAKPLINAPDRYPGPDAPFSTPSYGFTRSPSTFVPFWNLDRVAFDTWSRNSDFGSSADNWATSTPGMMPSILETSDAAVYPKPQGRAASLPPYGNRNSAEGNPINYDPGVSIDPLSQVSGIVPHGVTMPYDHDSDPMTPDMMVTGNLTHPFYGTIATVTRLEELLRSHQNYKWMPTPGQGVDRIPIWQNSFVDGIRVPPIPPINSRIYFPKGPRIYAIQISIRIYDESTKTTKEFKLIQRL